MSPPVRPEQGSDDALRQAVARMKAAKISDDVIMKFVQDHDASGGDQFANVEGGSSSFQPWGQAGGSSGSWGSEPREVRKGDAMHPRGFLGIPDEQALNDIREGGGKVAKTWLQGIPGVHSLIAGAEAVDRRLGEASKDTSGKGPRPFGSLGELYDQERNRLTNEGNDIPAAIRIPGQMLVGGRVLPGGGGNGVTVNGKLLNPQTWKQAISESSKAAGRLGAADAGLDFDPNESAEGHLWKTAKAWATGRGIGAGLGFLGKGYERGRELLAANKRMMDSPSLGSTAKELERKTEAAAEKGYATVSAEAEAAGGTSPGVQDAIKHPKLTDMVADIREQNAGISDAEIALSVKKRLTARLRGKQEEMKVVTPGKDKDVLIAEIKTLKDLRDRVTKSLTTESVTPATTRVVEPGHYQPGPGGEMKPIFETRQGAPMEGTAGAGRERPGSLGFVDPSGRAGTVAARDLQGPAPPGFQLRAKAERVEQVPGKTVPPIAPSLTAVDAERAMHGQQQRAFEEGVDATKRQLAGRTPTGRGTRTKTPEAWEEKVDEMSLPELEYALKAQLGTGKAQAHAYAPHLGATGFIGGGGAVVGSVIGGPLGAALGGAASATSLQIAQRILERIRILRSLEPSIAQIESRMGKTTLPQHPTNSMLQMLGRLNAPFAND